MKYSKENLNNLTYKDYILLMAEELNNNGFTDKGKKYEVSTDINGNFVSDFFRGFVLSLEDKGAVDFLKEIGLLNNGRCPLTGLMYSQLSQTSYTSEHNPAINYEINRKWFEYTKEKRNWGCFVPIPIIIVGIVIGIINGFNTIAFVTMGLGVLIAILVGMYGGAKFGNNLDRLFFSNELGINTLTLIGILEIEESGKGHSPDIVQKYEIPSADLERFLRWKRAK
ncbi:MAG: hypothetical protein IKD75_09580 [Prevotella sp.]|nr:hypothetical protein [Prevotella sp.]